MDVQKTKFGTIERLSSGDVYGYAIAREMTEDREVDILSDYVDLGWTPIDNEYLLSGGSAEGIEFEYVDEDGNRTYQILPYVSPGIIVMKTLLKKYVPIKDK